MTRTETHQRDTARPPRRVATRGYPLRVAAFDERAFDTTRGAILYLQQKAPKAARITLTGGVTVSEKRSRALVVSLPDGGDSGPADTLKESIQVAQEALDLWAIKGVMARTLASVDDEHIVWWQAPDGARACRIWSTTRIHPNFEVTAEVRDKDGNLVPSAPEPVPEWHPSYRFFRLGQATTDLVDAFRNYYLALESILSAIEPVVLRPNGHPAEREGLWLNRALTKAATLVNLRDYVDADDTGSPLEALRAEIYTHARTSTFHAKNGASVLLPHDESTRRALRDAVSRLRRLYLDLAQAALGIRFLGTGGVTSFGFQTIANQLAITHFYASGNALDEGTTADGQLPDELVRFDAARAADLDDEYQAAYAGSLPTLELPHAVRQVGAMANDSVVIHHDLEGDLQVDGLDRVDCVIGLAITDPQGHGTRYIS